MGLQLMLFGLQGAASIFLGQHDEVDAAHEEVASYCTAPDQDFQHQDWLEVFRGDT